MKTIQFAGLVALITFSFSLTAIASDNQINLNEAMAAFKKLHAQKSQSWVSQASNQYLIIGTTMTASAGVCAVGIRMEQTATTIAQLDKGALVSSLGSVGIAASLLAIPFVAHAATIEGHYLQKPMEFINLKEGAAKTFLKSSPELRKMIVAISNVKFFKGGATDTKVCHPKSPAIALQQKKVLPTESYSELSEIRGTIDLSIAGNLH